jgi:spore coat polysaccharide biosynthesis protein SpsF
MKVGAIIQARMGSTRLPGKVMKDLLGKTVLGHVIERVKQAGELDIVIIATSENGDDDLIEMEAKKYDVTVFRGSEEDVLQRYYLAARENELDIIVRITSDCPLIDPHIIDQLVAFFKSNDFDMVTNSGTDYKKRTLPQGLDTEVFSFESLENAYFNADKSYQREHVTPYIYENSNKCFFQRDEKDNSQLRWTLDTDEDFALIYEIYTRLYKGRHDFFYKEILELFEKEPELLKINEFIEQKKVK